MPQLPIANGQNHRHEFPAHLREVVLVPALARDPLAQEDAGPAEFVQPLGEHAGRDLAQAPLQLAEAGRAHQQLAHDEYRPALAEDLHRFRYGTELAVLQHSCRLLLNQKSNTTKSVAPCYRW